MHVRLLKKIGAQHFVGRVLASNAIVRFQPEHPLLAPVGALCHVDNCIFDRATKLVKCNAVCADETRPDELSGVLRAVPAAEAPASANAQPDPSTQPTKRKRVCFADDDARPAPPPPPCAPSSSSSKTKCA
jgi:hypothetical protein